MESNTQGSIEMDLKGNIKQKTGSLESFNENKCILVMSMLEEAGFIIGEETFRRLVLEFKGFDYLITLTRDAIFVILRTNEG